MRFLLIALVGCSSTTVVVEAAPDSGSPTATDDGGTDPSSSSSSSGSSGASSSSSSSSGGSSSGSPVDPKSALTPGTSTITINAAGKARSIILVVPNSTTALPLVIALHGDGDTNSNFITGTTNLEALATNFILAAPQGITQNLVVQGQTLPPLDWDPYRDVSDGNIDLPMLEALRTQLTASSSVDPKHVIVFGYSQGGYMSFRYGMDASASLACSAVMAAANPLGPQLTAAAPRKIPVSIQVGTNDSAVTQARSTKADLTAKGFPLDYHEIAGAGHVPVPGGVTGPLTYCLGQTLP